MVRCLDNIYKNKFFIKAATNMIKGLMDYEEHKKIEVYIFKPQQKKNYSNFVLGFQKGSTTREKREIDRSRKEKTKKGTRNERKIS